MVHRIRIFTRPLPAEAIIAAAGVCRYRKLTSARTGSPESDLCQPIDSSCDEFLLEEIVLISHYHLIPGSVNVYHVKSALGRDADPPTLTYGITMDARVMAHYLAVDSDDLTCSGLPLSRTCCVKISIDETSVIAVRNKTYLL